MYETTPFKDSIESHVLQSVCFAVMTAAVTGAKQDEVAYMTELHTPETEADDSESLFTACFWRHVCPRLNTSNCTLIILNQCDKLSAREY